MERRRFGKNCISKTIIHVSWETRALQALDRHNPVNRQLLNMGDSTPFICSCVKTASYTQMIPVKYTMSS